MPVRDLILHNFWWKLFSLLLAVAIWLYVDATTPKSVTVKRNPVTGVTSATLHEFPVMIFTESGDPHYYQVIPEAVKVTLNGDADWVNAIFEEDVQAFVDVKGVPRPLHAADVTNEFNLKVQVRTPFSEVIGSAEPATVNVRQFPAQHGPARVSEKSKSKP